MSKVCFDFFIVVLTFEKEGWKNINIKMRSNFQIYGRNEARGTYVDIWVVNKKQTSSQELNCENKMVKNRTVSKSQVQKKNGL